MANVCAKLITGKPDFYTCILRAGHAGPCKKYVKGELPDVVVAAATPKTCGPDGIAVLAVAFIARWYEAEYQRLTKAKAELLAAYCHDQWQRAQADLAALQAVQQ